ncbi:hypothetical protein [Sphingobacterium detergens]|uniref:hypothetical protein n=1 Tax=Sphingobacterium detergens TaxID=1145106 RepID=UPI003AAE61C3
MKNKEDKILVIYDSIDYFIPFMKSDRVDVVRLYEKKGVLSTLLKKIYIYFGWFNKAWYGDWITDVKKYSKVIIFATKDYSIIKHLGLETNADIYFWYWNPAFRMGVPKKQLFKMAEVWSFDPIDCERYNLRFNTTFFFRNIVIPSSPSDFDVFFLGINKGRRAALDNLNDEFIKRGLKTYFYIVPDKNEKQQIKNKPIPYQAYLSLLSKSRAILDLQPDGQSGLTLRPMESLFLKKKLITNNLEICNEAFYSKDNIFIIGRDSFDDLFDFISSDYKEISEDIVSEFDFNNWLERFDLKEGNSNV